MLSLINNLWNAYWGLWCIGSGRFWKEWGEKWGPIICSRHIMLSEADFLGSIPMFCVLAPNNYDIWLGPVWGTNLAIEQTLTFRLYYLFGIGDICVSHWISKRPACATFYPFCSQDRMCLFKNDPASLSPLPVGSLFLSLGFYVTLMLLFWCL